LKHLSALNKYFWKYRNRFFIGIFFVVASNYFAVLAPQITGFVVNQVQQKLPGAHPAATRPVHDKLVDWFIDFVQSGQLQLLAGWYRVMQHHHIILAIIRGILMFFMRQTLL
jgi:ATP-binding cassette subfamily B multidrug efflux pump